jgi:hypothetical protein
VWITERSAEEDVVGESSNSRAGDGGNIAVWADVANAIVAGVGNKDAAGRVHCEAYRAAEVRLFSTSIL